MEASLEEVAEMSKVLFVMSPLIWGAFCLGWGWFLERLKPVFGEKGRE